MGKFFPTMKIRLIFPECVRDKSAKDQMMVGGKMAGITDSISLNNPSIRAEEKIRPRLDYIPLAFVMPSRGLPTPAGRLEVAMHIQKSRGCQNIGYLHIPLRLNRAEVEIEIPH